MIEDELTPEEMLVDFEPDEAFWRDWMKWAEACDKAVMEQYLAEHPSTGGERE